LGTYTVTATNSVTSAKQSATVSYTQNYFPNVAPQLTPASYAALQTLNASSAFDLQFNSFTPNPALEGYGSLRITGPSGAEVFGQPLSSPSSTDSVLPAGTLAADTTYTLQMIFFQQPPTSSNSLAVPYFVLFTDVAFTTAAGPSPPQTLINFPGGPLSHPVLVPSGPVGSLSSPIGGEGASDFYELFWHGGTFDAIASISSANSNGSYEFELFNRDGSLNMDLILDAADDFSATINETLSEGLYEIGIVADSPFDPEFTIDFATPVEGPAVPEPATLPLLASACFIAFLVRVKRFGMGSRSVAGWSEIRSW